MNQHCLINKKFTFHRTKYVRNWNRITFNFVIILTNVHNLVSIQIEEKKQNQFKTKHRELFLVEWSSKIIIINWHNVTNKNKLKDLNKFFFFSAIRFQDFFLLYFSHHVIMVFCKILISMLMLRIFIYQMWNAQQKKNKPNQTN